MLRVSLVTNTEWVYLYGVNSSWEADSRSGALKISPFYRNRTFIAVFTKFSPFTVSGAIWIYSVSSHLISQPRLCLPCYLLFSGFLSRILSAFPGVRFVGHNFKENRKKLTKLNKSWQWRWRRKTIFFTFLSKPDRFNIAVRLSKYSRETQGSDLSRITIYSQWGFPKLCLVTGSEGTSRTFK